MVVPVTYGGGRQERHHRRELLGPAHPAERNAADDALFDVARRLALAQRRLCRELDDAVGAGVAGGDAVDQDVVRRQLGRQRLGDGGHRGTQRVGQHQPLDRLLHRDRRHVDDAAAAALLHVRDGGAAEPNDAQQQRIDRLSPRRLVQRHERAGRRTAAVGDEDVEAPEFLHRRRDRAADVLGLSQVGLDDEHLAAGRLDRRGRVAKRLAAARADGDASAVAGERQRGGAAEPLARRTDERDALALSGLGVVQSYFLWK
jgi:hypothetical protein